MSILSNLTPSQWFLVGMGLAYIGASAAYLIQSEANLGLSLTMMCYGIANFGMLVGVK